MLVITSQVKLLCRHLGWWYWQRVKASQKWLQAERKDNGPKVEKGEQRRKYACAHSLFVWRTRTLDRRGIWLVVLVLFWLLPANKSHVFSALPRGELTLINWRGGSVADLLHEWLVLRSLPRTQALLEIFDGSRDARIMSSFKNARAQGKTQHEKGSGAPYFSSFPWPVAPRLPPKIPRSVWETLAPNPHDSVKRGLIFHGSSSFPPRLPLHSSQTLSRTNSIATQGNVPTYSSLKFVAELIIII